MIVLVTISVLAWTITAAATLGLLNARGITAKLRQAVVTLVCALVSVVLSGLVVVTRLFEAFAGETLIARVEVTRGNRETFQLTYAPASGGPARTFELRGDQWAIAGGLVKWHPWLTGLGLRSYHKPMRVSGQFASVARQREQPPTVEALSSRVDRVWEALYWADPWLPLVDAAYESSASVYVEPGRVMEVYVSPTGYLIKRRKKP